MVFKDFKRYLRGFKDVLKMFLMENQRFRGIKVKSLEKKP
jgi:hypothetical protein